MKNNITPIRNAKAWGTTSEILILPALQVHRLMIAPQSECSIHLHKNKANRFYVDSGELVVRMFTQLHDMPKDFVVRAGEIFDVMPGIIHQFVNPSNDGPDVIAFEMYWCPDGSPVESNDIVRYREGKGIMRWPEGTNVVK